MRCLCWPSHWRSYSADAQPVAGSNSLTIKRSVASKEPSGRRLRAFCRRIRQRRCRPLSSQQCDFVSASIWCKSTTRVNLSAASRAGTKSRPTSATAADRTSRILEQFVQARLLTKTVRADGTEAEDAPDVTLEVTHEAIFRCWSPLQLWLNESARVLRWRRDVRRDRESAALNKQPWAGLKSEQLAISRDWPTTRRAELSTEEALWIVQAARRANRLRMGAAFIVLLIALLGALAAWNAYRATQESEVARLQDYAAKSYRYRESNPQLSALLAVEAADIKPTLEALGAMLRVVYGQRKPQLIETPVSKAFAVSPSQAIFATGHADGTVQIRPISRGPPRP